MLSSKNLSIFPNLQVAFQKRMSKHDLDFILDFDGLLSDQVDRFKNHPEKFRDFAKRFARLIT